MRKRPMVGSVGRLGEESAGTILGLEGGADGLGTRAAEDGGDLAPLVTDRIVLEANYDRTQRPSPRRGPYRPTGSIRVSV